MYTEKDLIGLKCKDKFMDTCLVVFTNNYMYGWSLIILRIEKHWDWDFPEPLCTFDTVDTAKRAKQNLNGADIYSGCCTLKIDFAKVS